MVNGVTEKKETDKCSYQHLTVAPLCCAITGSASRTASGLEKSSPINPTDLLGRPAEYPD